MVWVAELRNPALQAMSAMPATRGETTHFRRAEEQWRKAAKAREVYRRLSSGVPPLTLEQRLAWRRENQDKPRRRWEMTLSSELHNGDGNRNRNHGDGVPINALGVAPETRDVNTEHCVRDLKGSSGSGTGAASQSKGVGDEDAQSTKVGESARDADKEPTQESLDRAAVRARVRTLLNYVFSLLWGLYKRWRSQWGLRKLFRLFVERFVMALTGLRTRSL